MCLTRQVRPWRASPRYRKVSTDYGHHSIRQKGLATRSSISQFQMSDDFLSQHLSAGLRVAGPPDRSNYRRAAAAELCLREQSAEEASFIVAVF